MSTDPLADVFLAGDIEESQRGRVATVSSTAPLEVAIAGGTTLPASRLANYTPTLADVVWVTQTGTFILIHSKIISGG